MGQFGKTLREVRQMRNITQEELAEKADISRVMVGRYETTDQLPAVDTLVRLADALGTSTDFLLGRTSSLNAPFTGQYTAPPRRSRRADRIPKSMGELEMIIREIVLETMREEKQPDD